MEEYLRTGAKKMCFGCEACVQICSRQAIVMKEDAEGFRYPVIDRNLCNDCGICKNICPSEDMPSKIHEKKYVFGGYHLEEPVRFDSTSGGAFSAIVEAYCDQNYVIFGAEAKGLEVSHCYIQNKNEIMRLRKSKYMQSRIGRSYMNVKYFLEKGRKVLFSGTPCQIAGLKKYLGDINQSQLLTIEVICEGVPSPLYMRRYEEFLEKKYGSKIKSVDYRSTGKSCLKNGKWDFERMKIVFMEGKHQLEKDRWFNPFWYLWLNHLMSRPACYVCPFAESNRVADISLGDLWGVHLYCPELYGKNGGSSLVVCNTDKGKKVFKKAEKYMYGHELPFSEAVKYQSPLRKTIDMNPNRAPFMEDLISGMSYKELNKKWAKKPSLRLLWEKYIWGNRQKLFLWNLRKNFISKKTKVSDKK